MSGDRPVVLRSPSPVEHPGTDAPRFGVQPLSLLGSPNDPRRQELYQYLRDSLGIQVAIIGDTLTTFTKDSLSLDVLTHGDTVRDLDLSPAAERQVAEVVTPIMQVVWRC